MGDHAGKMRRRHPSRRRTWQTDSGDPGFGVAIDPSRAAVSRSCGSATRANLSPARAAGMNLKLKRTPGIYIIGFMGSGKSTVGRMLAEEIGWRFADVDDDIENSQRASISEIFATRGEAEFRRLEHEAIQNRVHGISRGTPTVLAVGG